MFLYFHNYLYNKFPLPTLAFQKEGCLNLNSVFQHKIHLHPYAKRGSLFSSLQSQVLRERMACQGCNIQRIWLKKKTTGEKCFDLQGRFDKSLVTSLARILGVTELLEKDKRNMIVDETCSKFDQTSSQVGMHILNQLSRYSISYGIKIAGSSLIRRGRRAQFKQTLFLRNEVCAKLFEPKHICCKFGFFDLHGFLKLGCEFIEAKYFSSGCDGIAFIH